MQEMLDARTISSVEKRLMRHKRRSILQVSQILSYVVFVICCRAVETGVGVETTTATPSVPRGVVDVVKNRLAEWQLTQHAHEERARVRDAQVAKTDETDLFNRTCWLNYC
jgi:hypothetical protein